MFSCIVTCYNRENVIANAINSILNQTYQGFEIILVDDGSADNSVAVVAAFNNPIIKIIRHEVNKGQNAALNTGVRNANNNLLAFLDSDDEWLPTYLEEMAACYMKDKNIDFAYSNILHGPLWRLHGSNQYAKVLDQGFLSCMIGITAKKEAVNFIGCFDERYTICQDDDFCFRLAKNFSFAVITRGLVLINASYDSMTANRTNVAKGWAFLFREYKKDILHYCGSKTLSKHYLNVCSKYFEAKLYGQGLKYYVYALYHFLKPGRSLFNFEIATFFRESITIFKLIVRPFKQKLFAK